MSAAPAEPEPPTARATTAVVTARALLLALAAAAAVAAWIMTRPERAAPAAHGLPAAGARAGVVASPAFVCPMHAGVVAVTPGDCPICGMALVPSTAPAAAGLGGAFRLPAGMPTLPGQPFAPARRYQITRDIVAPGWIDGDGTGQALLYPGEGEPGAAGRFRPSLGGRELPVAVDAAPAASEPGRVSGGQVRVAFHVEAPAPAPGTVGALAIAGHRYDVVTVPAGAVLRSPEGAFLFVVSADGRAFARRSIDVGRTIVGLATVLAGLDEGERVVVSGGEWLAAQQAMGETTQDLVPPGSPKAVGP